MDTSLQSILQKHHRRIKQRLSRHKKAQTWLKEKGVSVTKLRAKSARLLTAGALSGALLLNSGGINIPKVAVEFIGQAFAKPLSGQELKNTFIAAMQSIVPQDPRPLTDKEEEGLSEVFKKYLKVSGVSSLEGNHLNTTYGYTGEEQHLARYPGDSIGEHDELQNIGMAQGLGAWGYFGSSKEALTGEQIQKEKYYIAAQTLYLPDWSTKQPYLKDWYKFRKVLVVNPKNGQAAVAVIGDAGPADWTGKQFGSSPELMHYLGLDKGMKKGEVIIFFVDDKENKVPLGPVNYDKINT